jgi:hypothetical protein
MLLKCIDRLLYNVRCITTKVCHQSVRYGVEPFLRHITRFLFTNWTVTAVVVVRDLSDDTVSVSLIIVLVLVKCLDSQISVLIKQ